MARRLFVGAGLLGLAGIVARLASVPASPYLTARIGPEGYGIAALVSTASSLAAVVALLGLETSYARFVPEGEDSDSSAAARLCWRLGMVSAAVVGLLAGVGFALVTSVPREAGVKAGLSIMVGLGTVLSVIGAMSAVRRRVQGRYAALAGAVAAGGLVGTGTNVLLAALVTPDEWALILGSAAGAAVTVLMNGVPARTVLQPSGLTASRRREIVSLGVACTLTAPCYWLVTSLDRWILAAWWGESATGVYNFAAQFGLLAQYVPAAMVAVWLPELARAVGEHGKGSPLVVGRLWERVALLYVLTWVAVSVAGGDLLRLLSAPSFHGGAGVVPLIAAAATLNGFVQLGMSGHIMAGRAGAAVGPAVLAAGVSLALNLLLVPRFGAVGAAWAGATAFLFFAALLVRRSQQLFPVPIRWERLGAVLLMAVAAVLVGHGPAASLPVASLFVKAVPGLIFAGVASAIVDAGLLREAWAVSVRALRPGENGRCAG